MCMGYVVSVMTTMMKMKLMMMVAILMIRMIIDFNPPILYTFYWDYLPINSWLVCW